MNKLRRIFKSEDVVRIADAVKIPDCVVRTEPVILPESTIIGESGDKTPDIEQSIHDENISEDVVQDEADIVEDDAVRISYDEKQEYIAFQEKMLIEREAFIKQAQTEAAKIIEEAEESKKRIIAVVGPTASGKTALAIKLAHERNGEIISADSRLVYKGFNIASAKPSIEEREGIPHHLIDIKDRLNEHGIKNLKLFKTEIFNNISVLAWHLLPLR